MAVVVIDAQGIRTDNKKYGPLTQGDCHLGLPDLRGEGVGDQGTADVLTNA